VMDARVILVLLLFLELLNEMTMASISVSTTKLI